MLGRITLLIDLVLLLQNSYTTLNSLSASCSYSLVRRRGDGGGWEEC